MHLTVLPPRPSRVLALSDAGALVLFAVVGLVSHKGGISAAGLARDALPLLAGWFVAALAFRTYRRPSLRTLLLAWIVGIPLGVLLRALVLGRTLGGKEAAFLGISLAFTLLFILAFRLVLSTISTS